MQIGKKAHWRGRAFRPRIETKKSVPLIPPGVKRKRKNSFLQPLFVVEAYLDFNLDLMPTANLTTVVKKILT